MQEIKLQWIFSFTAVVIRDRDTGRSKGYGFVTFDSKSDAEAAMDGMDKEVRKLSGFILSLVSWQGQSFKNCSEDFYDSLLFLLWSFWPSIIHICCSGGIF